MSPSEIVLVIEAALKEKGIAKATFYNATGISAAMFSNWRKEKNRPSLDALDAVNDFLGTTFSIGTETKQSPSADGEMDEFTYAAHGYSGRLTAADKATIIKMMETLAAANEEDNGQTDGGLQRSE